MNASGNANLLFTRIELNAIAFLATFYNNKPSVSTQ